MRRLHLLRVQRRAVRLHKTLSGDEGVCGNGGHVRGFRLVRLTRDGRTFPVAAGDQGEVAVTDRAVLPKAEHIVGDTRQARQRAARVNNTFVMQKVFKILGKIYC